MSLLIIATRNLHKAQEIQAVLSEGFQFLTLRDLPQAPEVTEDAGTFAGNATKKALELARWIAASSPDVLKVPLVNNRSEIFSLADDSGLEVDVLDGAPGVHSARFAADETGSFGNSPDSANNAKLLGLLAGIPPARRSARFRCVLALSPVIWPEPSASSPVCQADEGELRTELFEGTCEGRIQDAATGQHGFGYDPLFVPTGFGQSFAELGEEVKNRISHRAQALRHLQHWFQHRGPGP